MADRADTNHSFRKFLNDPKTSVMGYIAENIPADRIPSSQGGRPPPSPRPAYADVQQLNSQGLNLGGGMEYQNQQEYAQHGNGGSYGQGQVNAPQSFSPPPSFSQQPSSQGYMASDLSQHQVDTRYGIPQSETAGQFPHQHSGLLQSLSHLGQNLSSHEDPAYNQELGYLNSSGQAVRPSATALGQGPPLPGAQRKSSPQSASRMYHRMMLEFEGSKNSYFAARTHKKPQEMSIAAYELESLSRKLWTLRRDHAGDFEEYSDLGHVSVLASWQAQYELWADTVLDLQDARTLGSGPAPWSGDNGEHSSERVSEPAATTSRYAEQPANATGSSNAEQPASTAYTSRSFSPKQPTNAQQRLKWVEHTSSAADAEKPTSANAEPTIPAPPASVKRPNKSSHATKAKHATKPQHAITELSVKPERATKTIFAAESEPAASERTKHATKPEYATKTEHAA